MSLGEGHSTGVCSIHSHPREGTKEASNHRFGFFQGFLTPPATFFYTSTRHHQSRKRGRDSFSSAFLFSGRSQIDFDIVGSDRL